MGTFWFFLQNPSAIIHLPSLVAAYTSPDEVKAVTDLGIILGAVVSIFVIAGYLEKRQKDSLAEIVKGHVDLLEKTMKDTTSKSISEEIDKSLQPVKVSMENQDHRMTRMESTLDAIMFDTRRKLK